MNSVVDLYIPCKCRFVHSFGRSFVGAESVAAVLELYGNAVGLQNAEPRKTKDGMCCELALRASTMRV